MTSGTNPALPQRAAAGAPAPGHVDLRGLAKHYGSVVAVDNLDLTVEDGEFFAMLGPSGSGKTTVLRMIAGFEQPTGGRIAIGGTDATREPSFRRNVNTVFQDYALFPHMTVAQNVAYPLRIRGVSRREQQQRAGEALEMVRLGGYGDRRPSQLSGGQRQRVALARALVNRPRILLLDEPLGALDLKLREQMQVELKAIQREVGITFIFVTHDQDEALTLCDRLAVFRAGRIEQLGSAAEIYQRPATRFVADFVGTSNVIEDPEIIGRLKLQAPFSVRPEMLQVTDHPVPCGDSRYSLNGTIREIVYAGSITRLIIDTLPGTAMTAVQLNSSTTPTALYRGQDVHVSWDLSAIHEIATPPSAPTSEGAS